MDLDFKWLNTKGDCRALVDHVLNLVPFYFPDKCTI